MCRLGTRCRPSLVSVTLDDATHASVLFDGTVTLGDWTAGAFESDDGAGFDPAGSVAADGTDTLVFTLGNACTGGDAWQITFPAGYTGVSSGTF